MQPAYFKLERFFAKHEFNTSYLMCCSDCESLTIKDLLALEEGAEEGFQEQWLGYTEAKGDPGLRSEIAALYQNINPDQVLVHSGAEEAIFNFMNVVLKPGDHIIVQFPCYQSLFEIARTLGCKVTLWQMTEGPEGWELDLDFLQSELRENTRAVVINTPHNPTGYLLGRQEIDSIIGLLRDRGIYLFCDEVYKYLEYDDKLRTPWASDLYDNAVSLGVMSKSFGLPGLRIGWIATRNRDLYYKLASIKDYTTICNSAPSEFLAGVALRNKDKLLERNRKIIRGNLILLDRFFERFSDIFTWPRPAAGPIAFPGIKLDIIMEEMYQDLLEKKGVLILPGNYYDFDDSHFRIGFGRKSLAEALARFENYIEERF